MVLVPGGNLASLGEEGAESGAWMAIDGMVIGAGRIICFTVKFAFSGCSAGSVCVEEDTSSVLNTSDTGVAGNSCVGAMIVGVGGGLRGSTV
jgi:hypothetical protein